MWWSVLSYVVVCVELCGGLCLVMWWSVLSYVVVCVESCGGLC